MASVVRVTKEFSFEMAHVLLNYDGPCRNVHGHSYRLFVTLSGIPLDDQENPKNGMVLDFKDLKNIIRKEIINVFDHSVVVSKGFEKEKLELLYNSFRKYSSCGLSANLRESCRGFCLQNCRIAFPGYKAAQS